MSETTAPYTARKIKAQKIAKGLIEGKTYAEIGREISPNAKYPSQTLYETLHTNRIQAEIKANLRNSTDYWTEERIVQEIENCLEDSKKDKNYNARGKMLELLAKWKAMLTEKREVNTRITQVKDADLSQYSDTDLVKMVTERLRLSNQGIEVQVNNTDSEVNHA